MIVKNAYYPHQMPTKIVVELQDGAFYSADLSPFRRICEADLSPLAFFSDAMGDEIPAYTLRLYGLALDSENPLKKARLKDGVFYSADLSPFRRICEADLSPLAFFSDAMGDEIPAYTLRFYGLALDSENPLKKARLNSGISQKQLADASGVNVRQIQKIESGEIRLENITLKSAVSLADALQIPVSSLLE